ncbi:MAG: hypothetical protein HOF35_04170 [Bacteroidetes bacterium]|nr:hypothetical protein [Bacteroidota bacterium]
MTKIFNKIICKIRGHASLEKQMNPSCIVGYVCVRCKDEVYNKTIHQFDDWKYESEKSCNQEMTCKRCNEKMTRVEHDFSNWDGSCYQTRQCKRCEHTEDRKNHSWDETNWGARTDMDLKEVLIGSKMLLEEQESVENVVQLKPRRRLGE